MPANALRVILIKPSKYGLDGTVERFRFGFMPNSTLAHIKSLTPRLLDGVLIHTVTFDEYVQTDLRYLSELRKQDNSDTLLALIGVQSHQFQRALDLAVFAREEGIEHCIVGGPHPMTCDTSSLHGRGISFSLAEAESVWITVLRDAIRGELAPHYGREQRWTPTLDSPVLEPLASRDLRRYAVPMMGIYPARGCPYTCNFCSVIKIAGRAVRGQPVETTIASLKAAKNAGVRMIMFTSDNFNKYSQAVDLLNEMIEEDIRLPFFVQCDAQIHKQPELVDLLARAGCFQMFTGVESFSRETLRAAQKYQNHPDSYAEIVRLCKSHGITTHFSNILGFPEDTESSIRAHLRILQLMNPDVASFYILTPIPGTQQYDEFMAQGLICESNLDRFDGTRVTWRHPHLSTQQLYESLSLCYKEFFHARDVAARFVSVARHFRDFRLFARLITVPGYSIQSRLAIRKNEHPMAGGILRVRLDSEKDYLGLRTRVLGAGRIPLPASLPLSAADQELNRTARLAAS